MATIDISKFNKASVMAALYNHSKPQGMRILHCQPGPISEANAQGLLDANPTKYFDYLAGRVMKIDLSTDELDTWGYDRDLGEGAAQRAIDTIPS
jgi:hypothetical protein